MTVHVYALGSALEERLDLGHASVGDADKEVRSELLHGLVDGCVNLLRFAHV